MLSTNEIMAQKALHQLTGAEDNQMGDVWQIRSKSFSAFQSCCCICESCKNGNYLFFPSKEAAEFFLKEVEEAKKC